MSTHEELIKKIQETFQGMTFSEITHTYVRKGKKYTSVSGTIKKFEEEFNEVAIATAKAKKYNASLTDKSKIRTKEYYLNEWKNTRDTATTKGKKVHSFAEGDIVNPSCSQEQGIKLWFDNTEYVVLLNEARIYNDEHSLAGTVDLICLNPKTGNLVLVDWKTNGVNLFESFSKKKLKAPFNHLYANAYNKYTIQLSLYAYMLEKAGFKVEKLILVHLNPKVKVREGRFGDVEAECIETEFYKEYTVKPVDCEQIFTTLNAKPKSKLQTLSGTLAKLKTKLNGK